MRMAAISAPLTEKIFDGTKIISHRWPVFLPDGEHLLFSTRTFTNSRERPESGIYLSSLAGKEKRCSLSAARIQDTQMATCFIWMKRNRCASLPGRCQGKGDQAILQIVADLVGFQPSIFWGAFAVAENGTVVYNPNVGAVLSVLTWYDRAGKELGTWAMSACSQIPPFARQ